MKYALTQVQKERIQIIGAIVSLLIFCILLPLSIGNTTSHLISVPEFTQDLPRGIQGFYAQQLQPSNSMAVPPVSLNQSMVFHISQLRITNAGSFTKNGINYYFVSIHNTNTANAVTNISVGFKGKIVDQIPKHSVHGVQDIIGPNEVKILDFYADSNYALDAVSDAYIVSVENVK